MLDGNTVVDTRLANYFRQDLLSAGKGNGQHGFQIWTPSSLVDGKPHNVSIRIKGREYILKNSPKSLTCVPPGPAAPPPGPPPVTGNFEGQLDGAICSVITGWVWDKNKPNTPFTVEILDNGGIVATTTANHFRQDLLFAGKGNGVHGFAISTPLKLMDGKPHSISVRVQSTNFILKGSFKTLTCTSPLGRVAAESPEEPVTLRLNAYPNPVADVLTVESQVPTNTPVQLRLLMSTGRVVFETNWTSDGQLRTTQIPMHQAIPGLYLTELLAPDRRQAVKVVKH